MKTSDQIRRLVEFDPGLSNAEIARALGCSRQNVSKHLQRLHLKRTPRYRACIICRRPIRKAAVSSMCRQCRRDSYAYEFACAECGRIQVVYGAQAASRRSNNKHIKLEPQYDYCDHACASRRRHRRLKAMRKLDADTRR